MVRLRADLDARPTYQRGRRYWLIRDPLSRCVLRLTDGDYQHLHSGNVHDPVLIAEAAQQQLLVASSRARKRSQSLLRINPLYIRLPGFNADKLLQWLVPRTRWLFDMPAVACWMSLVAAAIMLVLVYAENFAAALPSFQKFFGSQNWLPLAVTLASTKVIHELSHGIVCRKFGARCPEIGVLLLCATPCMYCDVTDTWALASRWQRAAVMLAGVYVEAILAAIAAFIWWSVEPGPLYFACMNVMFVCGVSTLLFNLNPLMRFDGYYVLSDLIDMPNLRQQAQAAWRSVVVAAIGGSGYRKGLARRPRNARWLALFHAASLAWRLVATCAIAFWILAIAESAKILPIGYCMATALFAASVLPIAAGLIAILLGDGAWKGVLPMRRYSSLLAIAAATTAILFVPLPHRISADGIVDFADTVPIYIRSGGSVDRVHVDFGSHVTAQQSLLQLSNSALSRDRIELASQSSEAKLRMALLRRGALSKPELLQQWDTQQASVSSFESRETHLAKRIADLSVCSPIAGIVLPSSSDREPMIYHLSELHGQYLRDGHPLCRIGDPDHLQVTLEIDADQRRHIDIGSRVRIRCEQLAASCFESKVLAISELRQTQDDVASIALSQQRFQVLCQLPQGTHLIAGGRATAKISASSLSMFKRLTSYWHQSMD